VAQKLNKNSFPIGGDQSSKRSGMRAPQLSAVGGAATIPSPDQIHTPLLQTPLAQTQPAEGYSAPKWIKFNQITLDNLVTASYLEDYAFQYELLVNDELLGLNRDSLANSPPFVKHDPEYNFFIRGYEHAIAGPSPTTSIPETLLPNIYVFGSEVNNENLDGKDGMPGTAYAKQLTLNGRIKEIFVDIVSDKTGEKIGESDSGEYFNKYVRAISDPPIVQPLPADLASLNDQYQNIIFPLEGIRLLKDYNSRKHLFPMFTEISFETDQFTEIAQILAESSLSGDLIKYIISAIPDDMQVSRTQAPLTSDQDTTSVAPITFTDTIKTWDITDWMNTIKDNAPLNRAIGNEKMIFMGGTDKAQDVATDPSYNLYRTLMVTLFYAKLLEISKNRLRSFKEICDSALAPTETVFYEIKKYEGATTIQENWLQSFYFVNSNEIDIINFVDTQVKYNKEYTYEIFGYQLVLGNKYKYLPDPGGENINATEARYNIENNASYKIFKMKLNQLTGRVLDRPPVFPDVDVVPYRAVNNKMLFNMNSNVGFYDLEPIPITSEDDVLIEALRKSQKRPTGPLEYKTDDKTTKFEVYRMEKAPTSYRDFSGNRIATIETTFKKTSDYFLPSASFVDDLIPNVVYYYTFRNVDIHAHVSNPSPIYRVKLVDSSGTIYPLIDVVELIPPGFKTRASEKPVRKYIQIIPSLPQTLLNESELFMNGERLTPQITNAYNALPLGVTREKVWNQKFKIRIVSKQTGRKFDLNVEFKNRGDVDSKPST